MRRFESHCQEPRKTLWLATSSNIDRLRVAGGGVALFFFFFFFSFSDETCPAVTLGFQVLIKAYCNFTNFRCVKISVASDLERSV